MIIAIIIATALGILDAAVLGHAHRTSEPRHALHAGVVDAPDAFDGAGIVLEMNLRRSNIKGSVNEIVGDVVGKKSPGLVDMGSVGVGLWIQGSNQVDAIVIEGGIVTLMLHVELSDECEDWFDDSWSLEFNLDDDGCMLVEFLNGEDNILFTLEFYNWHNGYYPHDLIVNFYEGDSDEGIKIVKTFI